MFVTSSNFLRQPYLISQVSAKPGFALYAEAEEIKRLKKLLGISFYNEFIEAFNALPDDWSSAVTYALDAKAVSGNNIYKSLQANNTNHALTDGAWWALFEEDNKWLLLINGDTYEYGNREYEWEGMVMLFTPYIFSKYVEHNREAFTGVNVAEGKQENADTVSPFNQIANSWNDFARLAGAKFCIDNSLYGYLLANEGNFDSDIIFQDPGFKNFANL